MKTIVITSYDMTKFYGAGIFQTTIAYATAFQKLGYNVKMLLAHGTPLEDLKVDPQDKLVWLGLEYISLDDMVKLENIDYLIYMGSSDVALDEGGSGVYEMVKEHSPDSKIIYASFYNILAGIIDGLTDCQGFLSVPFNTFSKTFDEVWILESHDFGQRSLLEKTFKKVKTMPLLVFEAKDYIQQYRNNKIAPVTLTDLEYDIDAANPNVMLNLDPNTQFKHMFFATIGSLDWLRKVPGRHIAIGNAFPVWTASNHNKHDAIYEYFNQYMKFTLTAEEYEYMRKQEDESLIWFYDRHATGAIVQRTKPFAVVISTISGHIEKWNVLMMDLLRMGVPVIHNFKELMGVGWVYDFPDAKSLDRAIQWCHDDLFKHDNYDMYKTCARICFNELASFKSNKKKIAKLLK